jgi:hypothetical protein
LLAAPAPKLVTNHFTSAVCKAHPEGTIARGKNPTLVSAREYRPLPERHFVVATGKTMVVDTTRRLARRYSECLKVLQINWWPSREAQVVIYNVEAEIHTDAVRVAHRYR